MSSHTPGEKLKGLLQNPQAPFPAAPREPKIQSIQQGDMEKEKGIPVQMLNDRDKVNRPNSQARGALKGDGSACVGMGAPTG